MYVHRQKSLGMLDLDFGDRWRLFRILVQKVNTPVCLGSIMGELSSQLVLKGTSLHWAETNK